MSYTNWQKVRRHSWVFLKKIDWNWDKNITVFDYYYSYYWYSHDDEASKWFRHMQCELRTDLICSVYFFLFWNVNSNLYESASAALSQTAHNLYVHYNLAYYRNDCQFDHRQILKQAKLFKFLFSIFSFAFFSHHATLFIEAFRIYKKSW